jgi:hypothetical protein
MTTDSDASVTYINSRPFSILAIKIERETALSIFIYSSAFILSVIGSAYFLGITALTADGIWSGHGDIVWFQALAEIVSRSGPFGVSGLLAWPDGYSVWSHPQAGLLILSTFALLGGVFGLPSSATVAWTLVLISAANSISLMYFFRGISRNKLLLPISLALALSLALSPFVLLKMPHLNVAPFFLIPIVFGILIRTQVKQAFSLNTKSGWFVLGLASILSPLWWVVLVLFILLGLLALYALTLSWSYFKTSFLAASAASIGLLIQYLLHLSAPGSNAVTRGPWDSSSFGGHLLDAFVSSPWLDRLLGLRALLAPGLSVETSPVGLVGGVLACASIVGVFTFLIRRRSSDYPGGLIALLSLIVLLFFLSGGIGELQAGVFVLMDSVSPARVWSRLIIILALLGAAVFIIFLDRVLATSGKASRAGKAQNHQLLFIRFLIPMGVVGVGALEILGMGRGVYFLSQYDEFDEAKSVSFISTELPPNCPVLQLPIESTPSVKVSVRDSWPDSYYRGFVPFLLDSDRPWSFGDYDRIQLSDSIAKIGLEVSSETEAVSVNSGFCAVLFDKKLAQISLSSGANLPGSIVILDSLVYSSERFDVFRLRD